MNASGDQISSFANWALWMAAQVGAVALFAFRVPLAAKFPLPVEDSALIGVLIVQLLLAAAMGRGLLCDWRTYALAISGAVPMLMLATLLSGKPALDTIGVMVIVALWLGVFAIVGAMRIDALRAAMYAVLLLLTAGAPILLYLAREFGRRAVDADGALAIVSPALGAISATSGSFPARMIVVPTAVLLIAGVVAIARRSKPRVLQTLTQAP